MCLGPPGPRYRESKLLGQHTEAIQSYAAALELRPGLAADWEVRMGLANGSHPPPAPAPSSANSAGRVGCLSAAHKATGQMALAREH